MGKYPILFLLVSCFLQLINGQDCDRQSCGDKPHTLCKYSSPDPSSECQELGNMELSQEDKDTILNRHNELRALVASGGASDRGKNGGQPAATNLGPLKWNDELAEIAQRWAIQCHFGHDECRNLGDMYVGQNAASISWSDSWHDDLMVPLVDMWYNEIDDFDPSLIPAISFPEGPQIGHYTQLVWAKSTDLGCGIARYRQDGGYYNTYLVCNYGPGGNIIGAPVYETA